jgi:PilX N-terminal
MRKPRIAVKNSCEAGIALAVAMVSLLIITSVVAAMIVASGSETSISANFRDEQTAWFAAKGGIEEVRDRFRGAATNSLSGSLANLTGMPGAANGVLYVTNPLAGETVNPWNTAAETNPRHYPDDELCKELAAPCPPVAGGWYLTAAASTGYQATPPLAWKWVRVMPKINRSVTGPTLITSVNNAQDGNRVCWDSVNGNEVTTTAASCGGTLYQVYELTALAETPTGSRRMVQFETTTMGLPPMPGAITFDGANPDFSNNPHSGAFGVSGNDAHTGCAGAPVNQPAIAAFDATSAGTISGQLNRPGSYTGTGGSPSVVNQSSQMSALATVDGLQALVQSITAAAGPNVYTSPATPTNLGTTTNPVINVVNGDLTMGGGTSGAGILVVTGTLTLSGNPSWNGIILVIGKGNVQKNGGGNGTLDGALFVANMYTDTSYATLIPMGTNHAPGPPLVAWNGGGNATVQFDSCWTTKMNTSFPYKTISDRELIY